MQFTASPAQTLADNPLNPTKTITPSYSLTSTSTMIPTLIPTRTSVPPTYTMTPFATKRVFMQYGAFGGDGGTAEQFYYGRDMPSWVIYTDGQIVLEIRNSKNRTWLKEGFLYPEQMCFLRSTIEQTGFFEVDPSYTSDEKSSIYKFDESVEFGNGAPTYVFQVNGDLNQQLSVPIPYFKYLVSEIKEAFDIPRYFRPHNLTDYEPDYLLLWIEEGTQNFVDPPTPEPWPDNLPRLDELINRRVEYPEYGSRHLVFENDEAREYYSLFDNQIGIKFYEQNGKTYLLIARPLLPHESQNNFSSYPASSEEFDLPFDCE